MSPISDPDLKSQLDSYRQFAAASIRKFVKPHILETTKLAELPADVLRQILTLSLAGKMIRGYLVTLGYRLAGGRDTQKISDASTFIEIAQTGILVHDDIMDEDTLRRGIPTIHSVYLVAGEKNGVKPSGKRYGESMAICAGDIAFYLSWEKLLTSDFPPDALLRASRLYASYFMRVAYGQILDISSPGSLPEENDILTTYLLKTAEYTGVLPLTIGALLAGRLDKDYLENLKLYGLSLGWIFQVRDDVLGIYGNPQITGKANDSDIREGKQTVLAAHFFKQASDTDKQLFLSVFGKPDATVKECAIVRDLLEKYGAGRYAEALMESYYRKALSVVPKLAENNNDKKILSDLLDFVRYRVK